MNAERVQIALGGYAKCFRERDLALLRRRPYMVRWAPEFLVHAREHGGCTFEQTLDLLLAGVGGRVGVKP